MLVNLFQVTHSILLHIQHQMLIVIALYYLLLMPCGTSFKLDYDDIFDDQPLKILGYELKDETCEDSTRVQNGSCQPWDRCLKLNGMQGEPCAYGFGVCCYWRTTCGAQTSSKVSQFFNPSYPGSDTLEGVSDAVRDCRFTVRISDKKVCQLRLDLDRFQLSQPEEDRSSVRCTKQRFQVRRAHGIDLGFAELCGDNSGQHLYVAVDASLGPTTVQMVISTLRGASAYRWKIRATQIDCSKDMSLAAPTGCLQYYNGDRGIFRSIGFGKTSNYGGLTPAAAMPAGLDYSVCIRRSPNACGIVYASPGMAFKLPESNSPAPEKPGPNESNSTDVKITSGSPSSTSAEMPSTPAETTAETAFAGNETIEAGVGGARSASAHASGTDLGQEVFVYIPGGVSHGDRSATVGHEGKFFGESLALAPVTSYMPGPLSVWVKSGRGGLNGIGFELEFEQITTSC